MEPAWRRLTLVLQEETFIVLFHLRIYWFLPTHCFYHTNMDLFTYISWTFTHKHTHTLFYVFISKNDF